MFAHSLNAQSLQVRVDLAAMAMKGYSTFPKAPKLETHHQMVLWHIQDTHIGGGKSFTFLQRCSWCILQPQPTGQDNFKSLLIKRFNNNRLIDFIGLSSHLGLFNVKRLGKLVYIYIFCHFLRVFLTLFYGIIYSYKNTIFKLSYSPSP